MVIASQYIVPIGCGRLGSMLGSYLSGQGNSVTAIDSYESSLNNLSSDFSRFQITSDASKNDRRFSQLFQAIVIAVIGFTVS